MPVRLAGSEECTMFELILGLGVSLALAIYLVVTLLAPERF
jgi:K+-transporting ATPase KdpF subunit